MTTCRGDQTHEEEVVVEQRGLNLVDVAGAVQEGATVQHAQRGLLHQLHNTKRWTHTNMLTDNVVINMSG